MSIKEVDAGRAMLANRLRDLAYQIESGIALHCEMNAENLFNWFSDEYGYMMPGMIYGTKYQITFTMPTKVATVVGESMKRPEKVRNW